MHKTKVVIIHNVISPHVTKLFQELSTLVDLTVLYCAIGEENRSWKEKVSGFKYVVLPNFSLKIKGRDLFTYFVNPTILTEIKKAKPDVVILAGWDIFAYQLAYLYCKLKGIKIILWSGSTNYEKSWRRIISLPLVKNIIAGVDGYVAYGIRAKEYLIKNGANHSKVFIYNHTTDIDKYRVVSHKSSSKIVILYYGQLIYRKGVDILISGFNVVLKKYKNIKLVIIGSGRYKSKLVDQVYKLGINKFVDFVEDPGDIQIVKYFALANIFVLPSREEVWGLVVNEAMAAGLPVVVSNSAGSSVDLVSKGKNGYIFNSEVDLSEKLYKIISNQNLTNSMGKESLRIINKLTPFNSARVMARVVDFVTKSG